MRRLSRLGFGGYRVAEPSHRAAMISALGCGVSVIDTSPIYGDGASERLVGSALASGAVRRANLTVITKVGLMCGAELAAGHPDAVKLPHADSAVCLAPGFIEESLARSTRRLGSPPDVVLLHNPEFVLSEMLRRNGAVDHDAFYEMLAEAFSVLERSDVAYYGISSNLIGCRWSVTGRRNDALEGVDLDRVHKAAGYSHRCSVVQLPLNLLEPDASFPAHGVHAPEGVCALSAASPPPRSPAAHAKTLGFRVLTHRPLHAIPPAEGLHGFGVHAPSHLPLREEPRSAIRPFLALVRNTARDTLAPYLPDAHRMPLHELAMRFALSAPDIDCVLTGMRTEPYVKRASALMAAAPLPFEATAAVAHAMHGLIRELEGTRQPLRARSRGVSTTSFGCRGPSTIGSGGGHRSVLQSRHSSSIEAAAGARRHLTSAAPSASGYVDLVPPTSDAPDALAPATDGGPLAAVGASDRGSGLVYRAGRLALDAATTAARPGGALHVAARDGRWLVKVQAPLDNSSDAAGGIGRMTPATLLVHDATGDHVCFVREEDGGHSQLLRCALRGKGQVAYLWAENVEGDAGRRLVRVHTTEHVEPEERW